MAYHRFKKTGFLPRAVVAALIVVILASLFIQRNASLAEAPRDILNQVQPGDILFVDFYDGWQHNGYWDHIALCVGSEAHGAGYRQPAVVEAGYKSGVQLIPLQSYFPADETPRFSIKRLKQIPLRDEVIQQAIDYALAQIGKPFDRIAIRGVLPLKITEQKIHCAELVWRAYKAAGLDLDSDGGIFILADDIYYSHWLEPGWVS